MDTVLVVAYSLTGTSRRLADSVCARQQWPLGLVTDARPRTGALGTLRCVVDSLMGRDPAIRYHGPDPGDFHTLLLVAPVWMSRLAAPMRSFLVQQAGSVHHVAVLLTMGSGGADHVFLEIERLIGRAPVLKAAFRASDVRAGAADAPALAIAESLRGTARRAVPATAAHLQQENPEWT
ncbi:flavodoxin [Ramlibacter sp. AW1]|uniref:Flavodoxin n=1 Tax=Ramlibacter aurantiacus TaxID=2801330 RepID=A0A936ZCE0_9BURK|nr:flavodoxin [Ramlibacter aurantiacus]MBL0419019.1 flavodoxin [Ramlibacter aurantiacus]